jgi:hypothetical protein
MTTLLELDGSNWAGTAELWLDPAGDKGERSDCTVAIRDGAVTYTWSYRDEPHRGSLVPDGGRVQFVDSWHSPEPMRCDRLGGTWGLLDVRGTYGAGEGPDWGWRITVSQRTGTGELVLQMTNLAPWGEHGRAVRMVCARQD